MVENENQDGKEYFQIEGNTTTWNMIFRHKILSLEKNSDAYIKFNLKKAVANKIE